MIILSYQNNKYKTFASILNSLSPLEFTLIGNIVAWYITLNLTPNEQNSIGNWFEMIGQIMLTYQAQATPSITLQEFNNLINEVKSLRKDINELKKKNN